MTFLVTKPIKKLIWLITTDFFSKLIAIVKSVSWCELHQQLFSVFCEVATPHAMGPKHSDALLTFCFPQVVSKLKI